MTKNQTRRLAEKLLSSENGRAVLSQLVGGVQIVPQENQKPKAIVATLTPCYKSPHPEMTEAWLAMQKHCAENGIQLYNGTTIRGSSVVHWTRNQLLANLIKSKRPWTHVLYLDDDIVPAPDSVTKLLSHNKEIIGAACTRRNDPPIPNIRYWQEACANFQEIFEWGEDGLLEIGGIGTGMLLITKNALEQIADTWFHCKYEKEVYGVSEEWITEHMQYRLNRFDENCDAFWFEFLKHLTKVDSEYGEDISFCLKAKRYADLSIWTDTSVRPRHMGDYGFSIDDFLPYRKQVKEDYERKLMFNATVGKEIPPVQKPEQEPKKTSKISVLIPTREKVQQLKETIKRLHEYADGDVEFIVRVDNDDPAVYFGPPPIPKMIYGDRYGYEGMHKYYNELTAKATGDWFLIWNDDAIMETQGWDTKIHEHGGGLKVLNATGQLNTFPIVSRELFETLGHFALQAHVDSWLQVVSRLTGIEEKVDLTISHTPRESYDTAKDFFTVETFEKLKEDIEKVKSALKPKEVAVG